MEQNEKLRLLKSVRLLDQIPEAHLSTLSEFLKPLLLEEGKTIFEEGSRGESLYFVSSGQVRISKRVSKSVTKDLAFVGPGDCFGEMALIEDVARSATATTTAPAVLFELSRADLNRWLKSRPELAMEFFAELVQVQSGRLRRTSNELTLLYDISTILLDQTLTAKDLLAKITGRVVAHLPGTWSAAAYLYNMFNDELDFASSVGEHDFSREPQKPPQPAAAKNAWIDKNTCHIYLPDLKRPLAWLVLRSDAGLGQDDRNETLRTLTTVGRLVTAALENVNFRTEELLRARLKASQAQGAY